MDKDKSIIEKFTETVKGLADSAAEALKAEEPPKAGETAAAYMPFAAEGLVSDPLLVPPVTAQPVRKKKRAKKSTRKSANKSASSRSSKAAKKSTAAKAARKMPRQRPPRGRPPGGRRAKEEARNGRQRRAAGVAGNDRVTITKS